MESYRMAAVGEADSIIGFLALGVEIHPVTSTGEAAAILEKLVNPEKKYGIIFITETVAEEIMDRITALGERAFPTVLLIPSNQGGKGYALERIRSIVERAVGADILMGKEGRQQ